MRCEICGKEREFLFLIETEGTKLLACQNCSSYGRVIKKVREQQNNTASGPGIRTLTEQTSKKPSQPDFELAPDYAERIRKAREKTGLTQEQVAAKIYEKESIIQRIEKSKMHPSESIAKKLENLFNINLFEEVKNIAPPAPKGTADFTLADMIKSKRKK
ncbi:MAG: TIGR00270 family protein [Candidatus Diapherotrites archaeon]|nr:TIGR00270 family protein [Candidatus Diapherotrites archaeon]